MIGTTNHANRYGTPSAGIRQSDVSHAADALLRLGVRPTVEKVRAKIGRGSPNTINPLLDAWWKTLSARLDSGPAALQRLPEPVAHVAEALWMQALEETRRRILIEQRDGARVTELDKQRLEVRSHVLTLREGELDSRLRDRDRTIEDLRVQLRELTGLLHNEQATRDLLSRQVAGLQANRLSNRKSARAARGKGKLQISKTKGKVRSRPASKQVERKRRR
jgi:hypothetical protein